MESRGLDKTGKVGAHLGNGIREAPAADLAKRLLEESASHCCSCELGKRGSSRDKLGSVSNDEDAASIGGKRPGDGMGGRTGAGDGMGGRIERELAEENSMESGETVDEKLPCHSYNNERPPYGDTIVTFVPEPEPNGRGSFIPLPISKCWRTVYREEKPAGKCVAKAAVFMVTVLLVGVACFLAGYFIVAAPNEESAMSNQKEASLGPVRIKVESALLQHYVSAYNDPKSKRYQDFTINFTKAIDNAFMSTALYDTYSHCVVDYLRSGGIMVEFTIQLHGPPTPHNTTNSTLEDIKTTTKETIEGILRDAATSGQLTSLNMDSGSIRVTRVLIGLSEESTVPPHTLRTEWYSVLQTEPGFINQFGCGRRTAQSLQTRIIGGEDARQGNWPWLGSMQYQLGKEVAHRCAASLLNPEWAITTAHCVVGGFGYILDHVIFGHHDLEGLSPSRQRVYVERIFVYPGYVYGKPDNDVALLKLTPRVRFDEFVSPACVETEPFEVERYSECYIAGWGNTREYGNISKVLQEAKIPLVGKEVCAEQYRRRMVLSFTVITDNMICAGKDTGGVDSCQSDSGGSLSCRSDDGSWRVVGLTSFGHGCGRREYSGVYTRLSRYWDYISSVVREPFVHCQELVEDTCRNRLPYSSIYPTSQSDLSVFLTVLPNDSYPIENNGIVVTSDDVETLMCLNLFPSCEASGADPAVVPCREFCEAAGTGYLKGSFEPFSNVAMCELYPTGSTRGTIFCRKGVDAACGTTNLYPSVSNHTVITFPQQPGGHSKPFHGCTWKITGPPYTVMIFKFSLFKFPSPGLGKIVIIGSGGDAENRSSALYRLSGPTIPSPLIVESNEAWVSLAMLPNQPEISDFKIETHVAKVNKQGFPDDICHISLNSCNENKTCFPSWWRCDGIMDCRSGEDEANCPTSHPIQNISDIESIITDSWT